MYVWGVTVVTHCSCLPQENLRHTHSRLRQQLEQIRARQEEQRQRQQHEEEEDGVGDPTLDLSLTPP